MSSHVRSSIYSIWTLKCQSRLQQMHTLRSCSWFFLQKGFNDSHEMWSLIWFHVNGATRFEISSAAQFWQTELKSESLSLNSFDTLKEQILSFKRNPIYNVGNHHCTIQLTFTVFEYYRANPECSRQQFLWPCEPHWFHKISDTLGFWVITIA